MSTPNIRSLPRGKERRYRGISPEEQGSFAAVPAMIPGESTASDGRAAVESEVGLYRSPGCFAISVSGDGKEIYIGEDWVGLGTSEDEGGLEGCSANRPGLVFLADGKMFPVGGKTTKTAASMYTEAGGAGTIMLLALIPDPDTGVTGIVFRAIPVSGTISENLGVWDDARTYLPAGTYDNYYIIPIAMLNLSYASGSAKVLDIYWNADKPITSLGSVGTSSMVYITGYHSYGLITLPTHLNQTVPLIGRTYDIITDTTGAVDITIIAPFLQGFEPVSPATFPWYMCGPVTATPRSLTWTGTTGGPVTETVYIVTHIPLLL